MLADNRPVKSEAPDKAPAKNGSSFNQLLGIKGAAQESVSELQLYCFLFPFSDLDLKFDFNFRCGWMFEMITIRL
ncbi:hypothetical protein MTR_7g069420 [Medicago truncatula]|uniref:Uncharacterized protein n=1 Tax=Medicago truncatula TaxID=3880 RepID=G7KSA5_MEDTR|nr:hypothetical protein MTR_7g069420 [Medicago truncatula]